MHNLGLLGSTVNGSTRWGGSQCPTIPTILSDPFLTLSLIVRVMNESNPLHDAALGKTALGGVLPRYSLPWNRPLNGVKN